MEQRKILIVECDPAVKSALEKFVKEGPYEILFVQTGSNELKIPQKGKLGVGTADLQLRNLHGIKGLEMSKSKKNRGQVTPRPIGSASGFDRRATRV